MTTITDFEALADAADFRALYPYINQIHAWVYITNNQLSIGEVANAFYHSNLEVVEHWTEAGDIRFYKELENVPGTDWMVVLIHPFYVMKPLIKDEL